MDNDEIQEFSVAHKRRYSKNHLWYQEKDDRITIGVTDFISQEKGEVLRVVLPHAGNEVYVDEELFSIDFAVRAVMVDATNPCYLQWFRAFSKTSFFFF